MDTNCSISKLNFEGHFLLYHFYSLTLPKQSELKLAVPCLRFLNTEIVWLVCVWYYYYYYYPFLFWSTFSRGCLISSLLLCSPPLIYVIPILICTLISSLTLLIFLAFLPLVSNILAHTVMVLFLYCSKILFKEAMVFSCLFAVLPR